MKKNKISRLLLFPVLIGACIACNDYDAAVMEYEYPGASEEPATPPAVEASWELELITNVGQHDSRVFLYKDKKYNQLFSRSLGWNGGEGAVSTLLPDGTIFWTFRNSYSGVVEADTRIRRSCNFPRNTIMVQTGENNDGNLVWPVEYIQTNDPAGDYYYHARTHLRHPEATLTDEEIERGETDSDYFYQAGDATVYDDPSRGKVLQVLWEAMDNTSGSAKRNGSCLAEYSLNGKPGEAGYLEMISVDHNLNDFALAYGTTLFEDEDGYTYLYTVSGYNTLVARTKTGGDLRSPWEFYIRNVLGDFEWQTTYPTDEESQRSYIQTTLSSHSWVLKKGNTYYMVSQATGNSEVMYIYRSEKPYGPFTDQRTLFVLPKTLDKQGIQSYNQVHTVNLHTDLSRSGELVFSTNTNCSVYEDNFNLVGSADYYRPYFYRIFNWESIYDDGQNEDQ